MLLLLQVKGVSLVAVSFEKPLCDSLPLSGLAAFLPYDHALPLVQTAAVKASELREHNLSKHMMAAAMHGHVKTLDVLKEHCCSVVDALGRTPLMAACYARNVEAVKWCLQAGVDPNATCDCRCNAVHYVVHSPDDKAHTLRRAYVCMELLQHAGTDMWVVDVRGRSALQQAAEIGVGSVVGFYTQLTNVNFGSLGLQRQLRLSFEVAAAHYPATLAGILRVFALFSKSVYGAIVRNEAPAVDMTDSMMPTASIYGLQPMMFAALLRRPACLQRMVRNGRISVALTNSLDRFRTTLMYACMAPKPHVMAYKCLLSGGLAIEEHVSGSGAFAGLGRAAGGSTSYVATVACWQAVGDGTTTELIPISDGKDAVGGAGEAVCVGGGASDGEEHGDGLGWHMWFGVRPCFDDSTCVRILLPHILPAVLNCVDSDGNTALHHACYANHVHIVDVLCTRVDIDTTVQNKQGRLAYECSTLPSIRHKVQHRSACGIYIYMR